MLQQQCLLNLTKLLACSGDSPTGDNALTSLYMEIASIKIPMQYTTANAPKLCHLLYRFDDLRAPIQVRLRQIVQSSIPAETLVKPAAEDHQEPASIGENEAQEQTVLQEKRVPQPERAVGKVFHEDWFDALLTRVSRLVCVFRTYSL